jgi:exonuclease III
LSIGGDSFVLLSVYRPSSSRPSGTFYDELTAVLETLVIQVCPVVVGGDFNVHVEDPSDPDAVRLSDLLSSFDMIQHVTGPTHRLGGTLDLVVTSSDYREDVI